MLRFYWYCKTCHQRGNKLFNKRAEAKVKLKLHQTKCPRPKAASVRSTKSAYLPIHV